MAAGYKINRSNYTIRKKHQLTSQGTVFERDFMTTTNLGPWDSGSIPYGESNFKMRYRIPENARKKPKIGSWLKSKCSKYPDFWNSTCVDKTGVTEEKQIKIKPNYNSLLDFAYFGSCQELVKSTIRRIVEEFPGEVNVDTIQPFEINGYAYWAVNNPFDVDLFDRGLRTGIKDFVNNYDKYNLYEGSTKYSITSVSVTSGSACDHGEIAWEATIRYGAGGHITISDIMFDGNLMLFTSTNADIRIRPKEEYIEEFFENLDDFGKLLLNRDSNPTYTAVLDWPHETDEGVMVYKKSFTWPVDSGGWNLDITSIKYSNYIEDILNIAEFYDEGYTDNLWRMLTHDSIKSMDLAFSNPSKNEDAEDYNIGATRLEGLMWAYGRQFDELKRAIDNIKFNSNITYDENNNMPDYFLSDALELAGWEVYNADTGIYRSGVTVDWGVFGEGVSKTYSSEDANNTFLRELKLNSKNIFSKKGTRQGIESLLGLFGLFYGEDYTITEQVATVTEDICRADSLTGLTLVQLNSMTVSAETSYASEMEMLKGLPFTFVQTADEFYMIPWFTNGANYYGDTYFQMNGGWGKHNGKYEETIKYLSVVDRVHDLFELPKAKRYEGAICFVEDISELDSEEYDVTDEYAHYFILQNEKNYTEVGFCGWRPALNPEGKSAVEHVNSIIEDNKGNNPHVGYGSKELFEKCTENDCGCDKFLNVNAYDHGSEYLERIKFPFKTLTEDDYLDDAFDCDGRLDERFSDEWEWVKMKTGVTDNEKVWFFGNVMDTSGGTGSTLTMSASSKRNDGSAEGVEDGSEYQIFDFESEESGGTTSDATEGASNSIINVKTVEFVFRIDNIFVDEFTKYLVDVILPYLKQIIPSTVIWSWRVEGRNPVHAEELLDEAAKSIALRVDGVAYGLADDISDDYIANYQEKHDSRNW